MTIPAPTEFTTTFAVVTVGAGRKNRYILYVPPYPAVAACDAICVIVWDVLKMTDVMVFGVKIYVIRPLLLPAAITWDTLTDVPLPATLDVFPTEIAIFYAEAIQRHLVVALLNMKPTVSGNVVEPFDVVGTLTELFSVFTQLIVSATPEKS